MYILKWTTISTCFAKQFSNTILKNEASTVIQIHFHYSLHRTSFCCNYSWISVSCTLLDTDILVRSYLQNKLKSVRFLKSQQRYLPGSISGLWLGHSATLECFDQNQRYSTCSSWATSWSLDLLQRFFITSANNHVWVFMVPFIIYRKKFIVMITILINSHNKCQLMFKKCTKMLMFLFSPLFFSTGTLENISKFSLYVKFSDINHTSLSMWQP